MNSTISAASLLPHYFRVYFIAFTTLFLLAADADGQSPVHIDSARTLGSGTQVTVAGWVTTQDLINGHVFIQDETAGIGVASSELADITEIGDSVVVTGTLSYFGQSPFPAGRTDGMLRLSGTLTYTHYPDAQRVMQPRVITLAQVNSGAYEGQLVKIRQAPVYDVGTTQYPTGNFQGNIEYTTRIWKTPPVFLLAKVRTFPAPRLRNRKWTLPVSSIRTGATSVSTRAAQTT